MHSLPKISCEKNGCLKNQTDGHLDKEKKEREREREREREGEIKRKRRDR